VSSLTLTELLCHLDELSDERNTIDSFASRRGQPTRARCVSIIPDHMSLVRKQDNPVLELEIIKRVLEALEASATLDDFYNWNSQFRDGSLIAARYRVRLARDDMNQAETRHVQSFLEIAKSIEDANLQGEKN
jgi:hypothetical protein